MKIVSVLKNGNIRVELPRDELEELYSNLTDYDGIDRNLRLALCSDIEQALNYQRPLSKKERKRKKHST